jgi:hypothetical protein
MCPNCARQAQIFANSSKQNRPAVQKAGKESSARLCRKVTAHGSRGTIHAGKRQVMETKGSALKFSQRGRWYNAGEPNMNHGPYTQTADVAKKNGAGDESVF